MGEMKSISTKKANLFNFIDDIDDDSDVILVVKNKESESQIVHTQMSWPKFVELFCELHHFALTGGDDGTE